MAGWNAILALITAARQVIQRAGNGDSPALAA